VGNTTDEDTINNHGETTSVGIRYPAKEDGKTVDQHLERLSNCRGLGESQTQGTGCNAMLVCALKLNLDIRTNQFDQRVQDRHCEEVHHFHCHR